MDTSFLSDDPFLRPLLENLAERLSKPLAKVARATKDHIIVSLQIGFEDYLKISYQRCCKFKTLLNPDLPLELTQNYINVTLTCGDENITDLKLIETLNEKKSVVVTGLAGSGKSMFMKFLAVSKFRNPDSRIPLFVDLRHTNQLTNCDLLSFMRTYCASKSNKITEEQFDIALKAGSITIILDGFDEIIYENRDHIQSQIFEIRKNYPDITIVVSSRPDNRFGSWSSFYVYKVDKLSKPQCLKLIEGLHYSKGVKNRFLQEVDKRLFSSHQSFLSSPLLTTIMLLTYEEFAEIPDKVHAFYSQAFDTLFQKHDAQKDQFQRKTQTGYTREEFRACFSTFCAMSYLEQKFSFKEDQLKTLAQKALQYTGEKNKSLNRTATADQFINDLISAVCMLLQDGLEWSFVHRSFQEYFAAVFVTSTYGENAFKILNVYSRRFGDTVIPMAIEMDREIIEQIWVLPTINRLESVFFNNDVASNTALQYKLAFPSLSIYSGSSPFVVDFDEIVMDLVGPLETLKRLYGEMKSITFPAITGISRTKLKRVLHNFTEEDGSNAARMRHHLYTKADSKARRSRILTLELEASDDWWLRELQIDKIFTSMKRAFSKIRKDIESRKKARSAMLSEYF